MVVMQELYDFQQPAKDNYIFGKDKAGKILSGSVRA